MGTVPGCPLQEACTCGVPQLPICDQGIHAPSLPQWIWLSKCSGLDIESTPVDQTCTLPVGTIFNQGQRAPVSPFVGLDATTSLHSRLVGLEQGGTSSLTSHVTLGVAQTSPNVTFLL